MADNSSARTPGCHLVNQSAAQKGSLFSREDADLSVGATAAPAPPLKEISAAAPSPARPENQDTKRQKMSQSFNQPDMDDVGRYFFFYA